MTKSKRVVPKTKNQVEKRLKELGITTGYRIRADDLSVDVNGDVDISVKNLEYIPVNFNNIGGNFNCSHNSLTSLEGSPTKAQSIHCAHNMITTLSHCSRIVTFINCSHNKLETLEGTPDSIKQLFCGNNLLTTLRHCPQGISQLHCENNLLTTVDLNPKITTLSTLNISHNQIHTLKRFDIKIGTYVLFFNNLISMKETINLCENKFLNRWIPYMNYNINNPNHQQFSKDFINKLKKDQVILENL